MCLPNADRLFLLWFHTVTLYNHVFFPSGLTFEVNHQPLNNSSYVEEHDHQKPYLCRLSVFKKRSVLNTVCALVLFARRKSKDISLGPQSSNYLRNGNWYNPLSSNGRILTDHSRSGKVCKSKEISIPSEVPFAVEPLKDYDSLRQLEAPPSVSEK